MIGLTIALQMLVFSPLPKVTDSDPVQGIWKDIREDEVLPG